MNKICYGSIRHNEIFG